MNGKCSLHPLDPLNQQEIAKAVQIIKRDAGMDETGWFETITLQEPRLPFPAANESTNNVNAGVTAFDVYGNGIPDQTGEGEDIGFRFFMLDDKIIVKLNRYENQLQNQITNPLRDGAAVGIGLAREGGRVEDLLDALDFNDRADLYSGALHFEEYTGNGLFTDVQKSNC